MGGWNTNRTGESSTEEDGERQECRSKSVGTSLT